MVFPCSWCQKVDQNKDYAMQWREGNLKECISKINEFQTIVRKRYTNFRVNDCPAMAYLETGSFDCKDPLDRIFSI